MQESCHDTNIRTREGEIFINIFQTICTFVDIYQRQMEKSAYYPIQQHK